MKNEKKLPLINRLWIYQKERFPIFAHGLIIFAYVLSGICVSKILSSDYSLPSFGLFLAAFLSIMFLFMQMRIADEFKDAKEDKKYRAYRPVPRGLISLAELKHVGMALFGLQVFIAYLIDLKLMIYLLTVLVFLFFMSLEFFVKDWLKTRPIVYMCSHMLIMPLIASYICAFDYIPKGGDMPNHLEYFLFASLFGGFVIEIGRKIRAKEDEEKGVETYSSLFGAKKAVRAWLFVVSGFLVFSFMSIIYTRIKGFDEFFVILSFMMGASFYYIYKSVTKRKKYKFIEKFSGILVLVNYLVMGPIPIIYLGFMIK